MNIFLTILSVVIIGIGIFVNRSGLINPPDNLLSETQQEVLSVQKEGEVKENGVSNSIEEIIETPTPKMTIPTDTPAALNSEIDFYKYPNAQITTLSENSLSLSTNDDADVVTSWYKNKISEDGMNVKSFVTTKTNDNVLNKLVGASGEKEVRVDIEKNSGEKEIRILVTIVE